MQGRILAISFFALSPLFAVGSAYAQSTPPTPEEVLAGWGGADARLDLNQDGVVNGADYALVLSLWASMPSQIPTLQAGGGFTADTAEPPLQGLSTQAGYGSQAMARWNFVPCQTFNQPFNIGVVAFHAYGINRVEFSLNGGAWTAVAQTRQNPESGSVEYFVRVDPSVLAAGEAEVRAVIYPNVGRCRVLGGSLRDADAERGEYGMFFSADPAGTLPATQRFVSPTGSDTAGDGSVTNPFKTIMKAAKAIATANGGKADGGFINLLPGDHVFGTYSFSLLTTTDRRWLTIRPAPGISSDQAPIVAAANSTGIAVPHVRFFDITFKPNGTSNTVIRTNTSTTAPRFVWLDGCKLFGAGRTISGDWYSGWQRVWATNNFVTNSMNGLSGELVRNCIVDVVGSDAFSGARLVVNSNVRKIDRTGTAFHPDFFQLYAAAGTVLENRIVYGCTMIEPSLTQGLFAGDGIAIKDIAFVDVVVRSDNTAGFMYAFQFGGPTSHMLVQNCKINGPALWRTDFQFVAQDVVIRDSAFGSGLSPSPLNGVVVADQ